MSWGLLLLPLERSGAEERLKGKESCGKLYSNCILRGGEERREEEEKSDWPNFSSEKEDNKLRRYCQLCDRELHTQKSTIPESELSLQCHLGKFLVTLKPVLPLLLQSL